MNISKIIVFVLANFVMTLALFRGLRSIIEMARLRKPNGDTLRSFRAFRIQSIVVSFQTTLG